jgi:PIN domain nuclease of toxin-antitoxin system
MGFAIEPITGDDAVRAASLIALSRRNVVESGGLSLSLGDGLCVAVAERPGLSVVGSDNHWSSMKFRVKYVPFR